MSASSVNLMVPMVAFPGRTSSSDAGSMLSLTQPTYQTSLSRSVPQSTGDPRSPVLSGLVDTTLPFTPFFLPAFSPDLPLRTTSWLRSSSPKDTPSPIRSSSSSLHQEFPSPTRKSFRTGSPIITVPKKEEAIKVLREQSPPPPQLPLGRLSIKDIPGSIARRSSSTGEPETYEQPPILSPGVHPAKSRRTSDSSTPCGLQIPQMNGPDRPSMTGSGGTGTENLNWLADVATAHSRSAGTSTAISGNSGAGNSGGHGHSSTSSPTRISASQLSPSGPSSSLVAGSESASGMSPSLLHSSSGSLFRPPISLPTPGDLTAQRLYSTAQYHHPPAHTSLHTTSSASGTNLPLYNQASHIPPYAGYGYAPHAQYGPAGASTTYAQLQTPSGSHAGTSAALGHRPQYFSSESYSAMLASMGASGHVQGTTTGPQQSSRPSPAPSQQPRSSAFHPASSQLQAQSAGSHSTAPSPTFGPSYVSNQSRVQNLPSRSSDGSPASRDSERSHSASSHRRSPSEIGWDDRPHVISKMSPTLELSSRSAITCKSPSSSMVAFERSKQSPTSGMWALKASAEAHKSQASSAYRVPTGKEGSLKHRILRPPSISILDPPPSTVMVSAPLSAPPTQTAYHETLPSPKPYSSASPVSHQYNRGAGHQVLTHTIMSSVISSPSLVPAPSPTRETPPPPPFSSVPPQSPHVVNPAAQHLQYPVYYIKGSLIQLTNGQLKKVEDMTIQDFVDSTTMSEDLRMDSCTVVKIQEAQTPGSVLLNFSVGQRKVHVTAEAPVEHPFFVFNQGWSSYSPEQTMQRYGLSCQKLKVGDICVSLTRKKPCGTSTPPSVPLQSVPLPSASTRSPSRHGTQAPQSHVGSHHLQMAASVSPSLPAVPEEESSTGTQHHVTSSGGIQDDRETTTTSTKREESVAMTTQGGGGNNRDLLLQSAADKSRTEILLQKQVPRKRKRHWSAPDQVSLETTPRTTSC